MSESLLCHDTIIEELKPHAPAWGSEYLLESFESACDSMALTPLEGLAMAVAAWTASVHSTVPRI